MIDTAQIIDLTTDSVVDDSAFDIEPIPKIAPSSGEVALFPFKLMQPEGDWWVASFDVPRRMYLRGALVRYGEQTPVFKPLPVKIALAGDTYTLRMKR